MSDRSLFSFKEVIRIVLTKLPLDKELSVMCYRNVCNNASRVSQ